MHARLTRRPRPDRPPSSSPRSVHEAKVSLDQAEAAFNDDATSDRTRDLSYVAQRKAELAMAQASQAAAIAQKDQAARDLLSLQAAGLRKRKASSVPPSSSSLRRVRSCS